MQLCRAFLSFFGHAAVMAAPVVLAFYIGYEVLPDGWGPPGERGAQWWSLPALLGLCLLGLSGVFADCGAGYAAAFPQPAAVKTETLPPVETRSLYGVWLVACAKLLGGLLLSSLPGLLAGYTWYAILPESGPAAPKWRPLAELFLIGVGLTGFGAWAVVAIDWLDLRDDHPQG